MNQGAMISYFWSRAMPTDLCSVWLHRATVGHQGNTGKKQTGGKKKKETLTCPEEGAGCLVVRCLRPRDGSL